MKLVDSNVSLIEEKDYFKKVELVGRTCYKSENKITEESSRPFVARLVHNEHMAMLEHAQIIYCSKLLSQADVNNFYHSIDDLNYFQTKHINFTFSKVDSLDKYRVILSGNLRALHNCGIIKLETIYNENNKPVSVEIINNINNYITHPGFNMYIISTAEFNSLVDLTETEKLTHRYTTMRFICDRGVSHELVRHRLFSFAQESTRYVKYNNGNMQFIKPHDYENWTEKQKIVFEASLNNDEQRYKELMESGLIAQQARAVLPNALKTEIVVTGNEKEWKHFFKLRCDVSAHPDMRDVALMAKDIYEKKYNEVIEL